MHFQQQYDPNTLPPIKPKKKHEHLGRRIGMGCILMTLTLGILVVIGALVSSPNDPKGVQPPNNAPLKPTVSKSLSAGTSFSDGFYLVGTDIKAGTYKTNNSDGLCYWERDRDDRGGLNSIIANDNAAGPARITLEKGEYFKSQGCGTWTKVR